jgi:6-phosphofructokinase 1
VKKIGILTGGGDAPGLNAVIAGVIMGAKANGCAVLGILRGWAGLLEKDTVPLDPSRADLLATKGGTILFSSRTNPYKKPNGPQIARDNFAALGLTALVACGGDDTLGVAHKLHNDFQLPVVGVPKTIDNDLSGTDRTFGFDTAVNIAMRAIDDLRVTAESHRRIMVVEVMGRHAGWIALWAGMAAAAEVTIIPEVKMSVSDIAAILKRKKDQGRNSAMVVIAEGADLTDAMVTQDESTDAFGHVKLGGVGRYLGQELEKILHWEARSVVLGHLQRGGTPSAMDRYLGLRFGIAAAGLCRDGKWGRMVSLQGNDVVDVSLTEAVGKLRTVPPELYEEARLLF